MARIRTIKPEFFRHEGLFEAEQDSQLPLRLAYAGLFTSADREGRFKWRPRELKLDALPHDEVDFSAVMNALLEHGFLRRYEVDGQTYGCIPSWHRHQSINNREAASTLPELPAGSNEAHVNDASATRQAHVDDATSTPLVHAPVEGKGKEGKGKEEKEGTKKAAPIGAGGTSPSSETNDDDQTPAEREKQQLWRYLKEALVDQKTAKDHKAAGVLLGKQASKYGNDVFIEAARATVKAKPGDAFTYLVGLCETAAGKRKALTKPSIHTGLDSKDYGEGVAPDGSF